MLYSIFARLVALCGSLLHEKIRHNLEITLKSLQLLFFKICYLKDIPYFSTVQETSVSETVENAILQ